MVDASSISILLVIIAVATYFIQVLLKKYQQLNSLNTGEELIHMCLGIQKQQDHMVRMLASLKKTIQDLPTTTTANKQDADALKENQEEMMKTLLELVCTVKNLQQNQMTMIQLAPRGEAPPPPPPPPLPPPTAPSNSVMITPKSSVATKQRTDTAKKGPPQLTLTQEQLCSTISKLKKTRKPYETTCERVKTSPRSHILFSRSPYTLKRSKARITSRHSLAETILDEVGLYPESELRPL